MSLSSSFAYSESSNIFWVRWCVMVVQDHSRSSKAPMRFPISLPCNCMPGFYCFQDITIYWSKICVLSPILPTPVSFEAIARGFLWNIGYENWSKKTRVPVPITSESRVILRAFVLTRYRFVTDGRTDGRTNRQTVRPPMPKCRALA